MFPLAPKVCWPQGHRHCTHVSHLWKRNVSTISFHVNVQLASERQTSRARNKTKYTVLRHWNWKDLLGSDEGMAMIRRLGMCLQERNWSKPKWKNRRFNSDMSVSRHLCNSRKSGASIRYNLCSEPVRTPQLAQTSNCLHKRLETRLGTDL